MLLCVLLLGALCIQWLGLAAGTGGDAGCRVVGGVDTRLRNEQQEQAQESQYQLSCNVNQTAYDLFEDDVGRQFDVGREYYSHVGNIYNRDEICRSARMCPGGEVTWCVTLFNPSEHVQICFNSTGITSQSDYARLLQLQCFFDMPTDCSLSPNCLRIMRPGHMLDRALMTCTTTNEKSNCSATTATILFVEVTGHESDKPQAVLNNGTELVLGESNLFLCTLHFTQNRFYTLLYASWYVDGEPIDKIHEDPFCHLRRNCNQDTQAETRNHRIRAYEEQKGLAHCPVPHFIYHEWLLIDNATEEDANHTYTCKGVSTFSNPFQRMVTGNLHVTFTPVYPLLPVDILEVPDVKNASTVVNSDSPPSLSFREGQGFLWTCAVTAGVGDELVWLLDGEPLNNSLGLLDNDTLNLAEDLACPSNNSASLYAVYWPERVLGRFERGYNATLLGCNLPLEVSGLYQCQLTRSRADPLNIWSIDLVVTPYEETPRPDSDLMPIGVYFGVASGVLLLLVILTLMLLCLIKSRQKKMQSTALNLLTPTFDGGIGGRGIEKKRPLSKRMTVFSDPFEYPREKLEETGVVLGEGSFGRVLQARVEGIVEGQPERCVVALKTCRENAPQRDLNELWAELRLMKQMKPHQNIVNLLGHCTEPGGPIYLIVEYAAHGSLKDYVCECGDVLKKLNHIPHIAALSRRSHHRPSLTSCTSSRLPLSQQSSVFSDISLSSRTTYNPSPTSSQPPSLSVCLEQSTAATAAATSSTGTAAVVPRSRCLTQDSGFCGEAGKNDTQLSLETAASTTSRDYINCKGILYMEDVLNFALQIACGLQHLEELEIAHCDLAARNVLVAEGFVLKIGDFGMARDISEKKYYQKHKDGRIPVKWSAPEVLEDHTYTHRSDIWSYGVVLWEILTYGQKPYPNINIAYSWDHFVNSLKAGLRLPQPDGCSDHIYELMQSCWQFCPTQRPSATELIELLSKEDESISLASEECTCQEPSVHTHTSHRPSQDSLPLEICIHS